MNADPELTLHDMPPMVKTPVGGIAPVATWMTPNATLVADFGNNLAGFTTIALPPSTGGEAYTITVKHGEMLIGDHGGVQNQMAVPPHSAADCALVAAARAAGEPSARPRLASARRSASRSKISTTRTWNVW